LFAAKAFRAEDYDQVPHFASKRESSMAVAKRSAAPLGVLLIIVVVVAFIGLRRYRDYPAY
ncbi:MAG: hypothetical protein AAFV29_24535, partial [Myxococcota bacterium]